MSRIDAALSTAFKQTLFTAALPSGGITLEIGIRNAALTALMADHNATSAAYITAWNPYSRILPEPDNLAANRALETILKQARLDFQPCLGHDPDDRWPAEPGFLVIGADRRWLRKLGRRFRQHALVICHRHGRPKLLWMHHG